MNKTQKRTLLVLVLIGLAYFAVFIFPNNSTFDSGNASVYMDQDEYVTYPIIERMLAFEGNIHNIWGSLIIYGDYHYGYPFYFFSMLVLLPFRLIWGNAFFSQTAFNILMLRQIINVLPMVITAGIFTYIQTRFNALWKSILIFLLLLTIPAVVRSNLHWWHPDSLMILSIALTFLFLDLDNYQLGKYFYLAAAACGMAAAIKLMGFFFFLVIPVYLSITWKRTQVPVKKIIKFAAVFVLIMTAVIVLSNPFLFYKTPREEMLSIQGFKTLELSEGYAHEESIYYSKGPQFWQWTLKVSYARSWFLYFLIASLIYGCWHSQHKLANWLLTAWVLPLGIYLMWFVAPKPDHYLLPLMLPLFSVSANLFFPFEAGVHFKNSNYRIVAILGIALLIIVFLFQFEYQLSQSLTNFFAYIYYTK